ncbi:M23 family metallopeptidase [Brevundimonas naejangsanensis]|uniref:M23 family metallopeptidase n=1 Tax=Brevundimonas naejangsanensis TaxID=588932 RepID=A0A494RR61_9CAUL|nr:peptidoglycan DD-metalloendopeptidase family protein [Brevundimonas naejangsanensis]AYG95776.1 M23 family metallopeptidase [Brevundimonas naejangsanensis]
MSIWTRRGLVIQAGLGAAAAGVAAPVLADERLPHQARGWICVPCGCAMTGLVFDAPGECPACGMTLVANSEDGEGEAPDWLPPQLEVAVLHQPTAFPAERRLHLVYEVHLRNHGRSGLPIRAIEVHDPDRLELGSLALVSGRDLAGLLVPLGRRALAIGGSESRVLPGGGSAVAFLSYSVEAGQPAPERVSHRILLEAGTVAGPTVRATSTELKRLLPPVGGTGWVADGGPAKPSHHRFGLIVFNGATCLARRYAIDWKRYLEGATFSGDPADPRSYHCYDQPVMAVADAVVALAADGFPDNVPRTSAGFSPAIPVSLDTSAGNMVVLDLGGGQYAHYAHLKPGSIRVRSGDRVRRGQILGHIGNSGDSREPHLHFHVSNGPEILTSEGLPYVLDEFWAHTAHGREHRRSELPLGGARIDFANFDRSQV